MYYSSSWGHILGAPSSVKSLWPQPEILLPPPINITCDLSLVSSSTPVCVEPVNRLGLHHYSTTPQPLNAAQQDRVLTARAFTADLLQSTQLRHEKVQVLEDAWPKVMRKLIEEAMDGYENIDTNMMSMLQQL